MGEMNNPGNPWHGDPPNYKKAFARIYLIVHGGPSVNAKLKALGMPPVAGNLATNPFPRVRVLWSPLAGGDDPEQYWPGDAYVDVGGGDIYQEDHASPPWTKFEELLSSRRRTASRSRCPSGASSASTCRSSCRTCATS
jgi:beta-mannanase